jgi:hypothetical protein
LWRERRRKGAAVVWRRVVIAHGDATGTDTLSLATEFCVRKCGRLSPCSIKIKCRLHLRVAVLDRNTTFEVTQALWELLGLCKRAGAPTNRTTGATGVRVVVVMIR